LTASLHLTSLQLPFRKNRIGIFGWESGIILSSSKFA
jgi:hypothetical protein